MCQRESRVQRQPSWHVSSDEFNVKTQKCTKSALRRTDEVPILDRNQSGERRMDQARTSKGLEPNSEKNAAKSSKENTNRLHDDAHPSVPPKKLENHAAQEAQKKTHKMGDAGKNIHPASDSKAINNNGKKPAGTQLPSITIDHVVDKLIDKAKELKSDAQKLAGAIIHPLTPGEILKPKKEIYLDGTLSSPDNKRSLKVVHNEILDHSDKKLGTLDPIKGKITFAEDAKEQNKDLNSYINQWKFDGKENGIHERTLVTSSDMSNGRVMLAESKDGERKNCDIRMGMLIDSTTGEQLGTIKPPSEKNGNYEGGSIRFKNGKEVQLDALNGSSFEFELMGQTGKQGRSIRIYATDKAQEKLVDLDKLTDDARRNRDKASYAFSEESNKSYLDVSKYWNSASGKKAELKEESDAATKTHKEAEDLVEQLLSAKSTKALLDPSKDIYDEFKIKHAALKEAPNSRSSEQKLISVKELRSDEDTNKVNAKLRIGNDLYEIQKGDLFRVNEDASGMLNRETDSCGELKPGYRISFKDGRNVNLHSENRVILDMQIEGETERHQIVGLGAARKADDGSMLPGGLVDRRALRQEADLAADEAGKGNIKYFENKPIITGGVTDFLMGGRQNIIEGIQDSVKTQVQAINKELDQLFADESFKTDNFDNNRIDQNLRATTNFMRDLNLSAQDSQQLAEDGLQLQHSASEGATIAATTFLTMGVGTVVNGFVKAGQLSRMAGAGIELASCTVAGGSSSVVMRHTRATDAEQVGRNFAGGMVEGATMFVGGQIARGFAELKSLVPVQRIARELEIVNGTGATTAGGKLVNAMAGSRTAENLITGAVKIGNAGLQTTGFTLAGAARQKEGSWSDYVSAGKLATGTLWFLTGDLAGSMLGRGITGMNRAAQGSSSAWLNTLAREHAKDSIISRQISSIPTTTTTMFTFSSLGAIESAYDSERKQLAKELNKAADQISFSDVWKHSDKGAILHDALSQGAMAAIFSPAVAIGHGGIEAVEKRFGPKAAETQATKSAIPDLYHPDPEAIAQQAESSGKVMLGTLSTEAAGKQFSKDATASIENLLNAARSSNQKGDLFIDATEHTAEETKAMEKEAAVLQVHLNKYLKQMNLPTVELQVKDLSHWGVVPAYYNDGVVVLNSKQLGKLSVSEIRGFLYHELTHHDQTALVIKRVLDQQNIGTTADAKQMSDIVAKCTELTKRADGKEDGLSFSEKMVRQVIELRKGEPLTEADAKRADKLASDYRNYVEIPELHKIADAKYDTIYEKNAKLQNKALNEFLADMGNTKNNKYWWGAESSATIQARVSEFKTALTKMPAEKAKHFLSELLKQRTNEVNAEWKAGFDKYMQLPELEAYSNQRFLEALSSQIDKVIPKLELGFEATTLEPPSHAGDKGIYSYRVEKLDPKSLDLEYLDKAEYLENDQYLHGLETLLAKLGTNSGLTESQINRINETATSIRQEMEHDIYTLPSDKLATEEQKLALAWHVLWENLQKNRYGTEGDEQLRRCKITADEISFALLALTAGTNMPKYPTLDSVLNKLCPQGIPSMFKVPLKPMTKGDERRIAFPIDQGTIDHHFKAETPSGRVMDPQHIYKSHLVWSFLNGVLPEGVLVTEFEKLAAVGASRRPGYQYTLDYEASARKDTNGRLAKYRNPITVIIEELTSASGTHWIYKTHYENSNSYRAPQISATTSQSNSAPQVSRQSDSQQFVRKSSSQQYRQGNGKAS